MLIKSLRAGRKWEAIMKRPAMPAISTIVTPQASNVNRTISPPAYCRARASRGISFLPGRRVGRIGNSAVMPMPVEIALLFRSAEL